MNFINIFFYIIIGLLSGWIVNYVSDILPITRNIRQPVCPKCRTPYSWREYLTFKQCSMCKYHRTIRTWSIFVIYPIVSLFIYFFPRPIMPYWLGMIVLIYFGTVMIIDLEHRVVMHPVSIFGIILGLAVGLYLRSTNTFQEGLFTTLAGGILGFVVMLVLYWLGVLYVRLVAKKKGLPSDEVALGFGDVNLAGILGLMLGVKAIVACLFIAIVGGGVVSLVIIIILLIAKKFHAFTAIPYAPFLILAATYILFS